jgi:hypothetical protein
VGELMKKRGEKELRREKHRTTWKKAPESPETEE